MTSPGGGFSSGDDFVAAKVSIDIPSEGLSSIKELSSGMERFRTTVEAAAKSSASFVGYLQQMTQAANVATEAHLKLSQQLERNANLQAGAMGGGGSASQQLPLSRSVPQGYVDNFAGMGAGMGGTRGPSPSDAPGQIAADINQVGPQQYVNAQAGRYRTAPGVPMNASGSPDWQAQSQRLADREKMAQQQATATSSGNPLGGSPEGLINNILNEMRPGGSYMGTMGMIQRGLGSVGGRMSTTAAGDEVSGPSAMSMAGLGGLLGKLGPVGGIAGVAGAGLAGLGLLEKGGGIYQQYKNLGNIRGGGAGEGLQDEMQIRSLALNPFLSTKQARDIIMAGLTEGYSGKSFDTVTQYLASNLKEMNVEVADSVAMLRTSILGGQTPAQGASGISSSLGILKGLSQGGVTSNPDLQKNFQSLQEMLVAQGAPAGQANMEAIQGAAMWNTEDTRALKNEWPGYQQAMLNSPAMMAQIGAAAGIKGVTPGPAMAMYMQENGMNMTQLSSDQLRRLVLQVFNTPESRQYGTQAQAQASMLLMQRLKAVMPGSPGASDINEAWNLAKSVIGGKDYGQQAQQDVKAEEQKVTPGMHGMSVVGQIGGALGHGAFDFAKIGADLIHGDTGGAGRAWNDMGKVNSNAIYNIGADAQNDVLNNLVNQFGANDIQVGSGNDWSALTGSKAQVEGFAQGKLNWRRKEDKGGGQSISDTPRGSLPSDYSTTGKGGGTSQVGVSFSPAQVQIKFDNNGQATASPNPVQLTPNQQQAMAGYGTNTMNNPPPGDGFGYYRGRLHNGFS